jgi:hypothetical protein
MDIERRAGERRVALPGAVAEVRLRAEDKAGNRRAAIARTR